MDKRTVMIFGVGTLQRSIIERAKAKGLRTVGIDPLEDAACRDSVDVFEVVGGQDYEGTIDSMRRNNVSAIVTAATDKPLVMMARVAEAMHLPFYSVETAEWSTDKYLMKQHFMEAGIPCAKGRLVESVEELDDFVFPVIVKPRDNSGSRGVIFCDDKSQLCKAFDEAKSYSRKSSVLVEEYIEGKEYSIESLHFEGKTEVIQITEKHTTPFPYNVEVGHVQPAGLSEELTGEISMLIRQISDALHFENCASHTELKINNRGIFIIETSPRLGGDYITSMLVPLSTGINIEDQLLNIALGNSADTVAGRRDGAAAVSFLQLEKGTVADISPAIQEVAHWPHVKEFSLSLKEGDKVGPITSSLNRYGEFVVAASNREEAISYIDRYSKEISNMIQIEP